MRWIKLGAWLLAWSVWAWLGFGLHRELPRPLGQPLTHLHVDEEQVFRGFIAGTHEFVTSEMFDGAPSKLRFWDAHSGRLIRQLEGPAGDFYVRRREALVVGRRFVGSNVVAPTTTVWDLRTGASIELPAGRSQPFTYHFTRPWAIAEFGWRHAGWDGRSSGFAVVDLRSGKDLFVWNDAERATAGRVRSSTPAFVDELMMAVPTRKQRTKRSSTFWTLGMDSAPMNSKVLVWKGKIGIANRNFSSP